MTRYIIDKETGKPKAMTEAQAHPDATQEANRIDAFEQGRLQALEEFSNGRGLVVFNLETKTIQATSRAKALFPATVKQLEQVATKLLSQLDQELDVSTSKDKAQQDQLDLLQGP